MRRLSNNLVEDNTKDPMSWKYMLHTFCQYNVGVLLVRIIQLYSLSKKYPSKYDFTFETEIMPGNTCCYLSIKMIHDGQTIIVDDLPQEIELYISTPQDIDNIVLKWSVENRKDKLSLNEDTEMISAHFRGGGKDVIKSSDGRVEYLTKNILLYHQMN